MGGCASSQYATEPDSSTKRAYNMTYPYARGRAQSDDTQATHNMNESKEQYIARTRSESAPQRRRNRLHYLNDTIHHNDIDNLPWKGVDALL